MNDLRIISFLPSATELACELGLIDSLVAVSHECDYPTEVAKKPVIVHSALPVKSMTLGEIDVAVSARLRSGESLYEVDEQLLRELAPTHILTQDLCQVCAPAGNEVSRALAALKQKPEIVWMSPHSVADIHNDLRNLARLTNRQTVAEELIAGGLRRLDAIRERVKDRETVHVFCAEWTEPLYCCGHWVPELLEIAGGLDPLGRKWTDSVRVSFEQVTAARPEALIVMACGYKIETCTEQARRLMEHPDAQEWPAVRNGKVFGVDATLFSRPGLRVINGAELLARILHPEAFEDAHDAQKEAGARLVTVCA